MICRAWFLLAAVVALAETSWGQRASNWRVYKAADGLAESACSSVTISPHGKVWVKHFTMDAVSGLNGYNVQNVPTSGAGNNRVYESPGGQLWTTSEEGLQEFKDGNWVRYPVREVAAEFRGNAMRLLHPIPLCPVRQGRIIFLLSDGLMEFNAESPDLPRTTLLHAATGTKLGKFLGMIIARDGGLWIAGAHGLARVPGPGRMIKPETEWREFVPPEPLQIQNLQEPVEDDEGGITAIAETPANHQKLVVYFDGQHWTTRSAGNEKIRLAWRGPDRRFWAATIDSVFQLEEGRPDLTESEEISAHQYFDLAVEPGGAFWLATSDGLFRCAPRIWQIPGALPKISSLVHAVAEDKEGCLWFASANALHALQADHVSDHPFPASFEGSLQSTHALFPLPNGAVVMDTGNGLFQFRRGRSEFSPLTRGKEEKQLKPLGSLKNGALCIQILDPEAPAQPYSLQSYDGIAFRPLPCPQPGQALTGELLACFAAQNGNLWLSSSHAVACYHDDKWETFSSTDGTVPQGAAGFIELPDGKIWCATQDKVWEFNGRSWSVVRAGFDRINALLRSRDGSTWVASNTGLHHFSKNAWVENGTEDGLPSSAIRQVIEDHQGRIWARTSRGLSLQHPEADADPPQTYLEILSEKEKTVPEGTTLTLALGGRDKWKYTSRDRLLYSYRLDEMDWSAFQEANNVSFSDLPGGKHYFQVRAMDRNCNVDPKSAKFAFTIALAWYKETRLLWISIGGLSIAIFFAGLAFNRHRQLVRSYAEVEQKVAERTRQLEIASQELLHSQKMNALGTLAAGIAHDFNNILSIIKGSAQIIEDNLDNPQKVHTRVDRIKTVVEQGAGIVKAMLGFSRASDQQPSLCDVNATVEETIKLLGDRFVREVEVRFEPAPNLPGIPASQDFIQQILLNFVFNAAEAMTERREVVLTTGSLSKLPPGLVLMPAETAAYVFISVTDLGSGIKPENLPRIFEPFFTTKAMSARRGTGLGLSMVYELAKKMDAGLAVKSEVDQGSTFTLLLPVRDLPLNSKT
jgi:signal transduction histidine kinase